MYAVDSYITCDLYGTVFYINLSTFNASICGKLLSVGNMLTGYARDSGSFCG